jgi:hypothetical protein
VSSLHEEAEIEGMIVWLWCFFEADWFLTPVVVVTRELAVT